MTKATPFVKTIIVVVNLHDHIRGYPLKGREFLLMEPEPRMDEAITLDGHKIPGEYWVVSKSEYMKVCPEAQKQDLEGDCVYIPVWAAKTSIRPCYIDHKDRPVF